jgi:hypothetical protein
MCLGRPCQPGIHCKGLFQLCVVAACLIAVCSPCRADAVTADLSGSLDVLLTCSSEMQPRANVILNEPCLLLSQQIAGINLSGGFASFRWGPGRNGSLCLSGVADPMPVLAYRLAAQEYEYVRFVGLMERDSNRTLIGQRLNIQATPRLRMAISETAILSSDPSPFFYWPFPGLPLYVLQHVLYHQDVRPGNDANVNLGLDFSLTLGESPAGSNERAHRTEIYGEILIDDAQSTPSSRSWIPDFVGALVGLDIHRRIGTWQVTLNGEYTRISNYVYSHRVPNNNYIYHGVGLGHPLGPDADATSLTLTARPSPRTSIEVKSTLERHGEGHIGLPWSRELGSDGTFLSGVVETRSKCALSLTQEFTKNLSLSASLEMVSSENHENTEGVQWKGWVVGVGLRAAISSMCSP